MAVGLPRSVLAGTARHGAQIIRNAILQRRGVTGRGYGADPYEDRDPYQTRPSPRRALPPPVQADPYDRPRIPTPTPTPAPTPAPSFFDRFAGTGGPGGNYTKKGVWEPYGYGQEPGKTYSGFNTATQWRQAIEGLGEMTMADLAAQADDIYSRYDTHRQGVARRAAAGRGNAYEDAVEQMPTYDTLSPELFQSAYEQSGRYAPGVSTSTGREQFGEQPIGFDQPGVAFLQGPQLAVAATAPYVTGGAAGTQGAQRYGPNYGPTNYGPAVFHPGTEANTLQATRRLPSPPPGTAGLGLMLGPGDPDALAGATIPAGSSRPPFGSWAPTALPEVGAQYGNVSYNPAADWERAQNVTGAARQMRDYGTWRDTEMGNIDTEFAQPFADIEQAAQITPREWMINAAVNGYGVDPNVAAGMFNEDWGRDYLREAGADEMSQFYQDRNLQALDEYGVPYSEIPEPPTAGQTVADIRAREALAVYEATGMWPEGYEDYVAEQNKANLYGPLDEVFGADANAILQSANMTPEQALSFVEDGTFQDAYNDLLSTVNPDTGTLDEQAAVDALRRAYRIDPNLARLLEIVAPQFAGSDYLLDDAAPVFG